MKEIKLSGNNSERHDCIAFKSGDWVIFKCPICDDYERRVHLVTGEMISPKGFNTILHNGVFSAVGLQPELYNPN